MSATIHARLATLTAIIIQAATEKAKFAGKIYLLAKIRESIADAK
jgi:hypothetical protein